MSFILGLLFLFFVIYLIFFAIKLIVGVLEIIINLLVTCVKLPFIILSTLINLIQYGLKFIRQHRPKPYQPKHKQDN